MTPVPAAPLPSPPQPQPLPRASLIGPAPSDWPAACGAAMTTRLGGVGVAPFDTLNMKAREGEEADALAVSAHRAGFVATTGARPVWLEQVHGARVVRVSSADLAAGAATPVADASVTTEPGIACTVLVADCLPVLLADRAGRVVGAAHAGWRGLAGGVVEATVDAMRGAVPGLVAGDLVAWLGACIGPDRFEVGDDVRDAFVAAMGEGARARFREAPVRDGVRKWHADLPGLAADRLGALGVAGWTSAAECTVNASSRFFSFRREGRTGRMAAASWIVGR
jgi:hypothetical protein